MTAPQAIVDAITAPESEADPFNLRGAAAEAVDRMPRTPLQRLNRSLRRSPALADLRRQVEETLRGEQ